MRRISEAVILSVMPRGFSPKGAQGDVDFMVVAVFGIVVGVMGIPAVVRFYARGLIR